MLNNFVGIGSIIRIINRQDIAITGIFENFGYLTLLTIRIDTIVANNNVI